MVRKSEIPDTSGFTLFNQKIKYSVIQVSSFKGFHSSHADAVEQHIINVVNL